MADPEESPRAALSFTVDPKLGSVSQLGRPCLTASQVQTEEVSLRTVEAHRMCCLCRLVRPAVRFRLASNS